MVFLPAPTRLIPSSLSEAFFAPAGVTPKPFAGELPPKMHRATALVAQGVAVERRYKALDIYTGIGAWFSNEAKFGGDHLKNPVMEFFRSWLHSETKHGLMANVMWQFAGAGIGAVLNDVPKAYGYGLSTIYMARAQASLWAGDLDDDPYERARLQRMIVSYMCRSVPAMGEKIFQVARFGLLGASVFGGCDTLAESFVALIAAKSCCILATPGTYMAKDPALQRVAHEKRVNEARREGKWAGRQIRSYIELAQHKISEKYPKSDVVDSQARLQNIHDECSVASANVCAELVRLEREISVLQEPLERGLLKRGLDFFLRREVDAPEVIARKVAAIRDAQKNVLREYLPQATQYLNQAHREICALGVQNEVIPLIEDENVRHVLEELESEKMGAQLSDDDVRIKLGTAFARLTGECDPKQSVQRKDSRLNLAQISAAFNAFYDTASSSIYHGLTVYYTWTCSHPGDFYKIFQTVEAHAVSVLTGNSQVAPVMDNLQDLNATLGGAIEFDWYVMAGLTLLSTIGPYATLRQAIADRRRSRSEGLINDPWYYNLSITSEVLKFFGLVTRNIPVIRPISVEGGGVGAWIEGKMHGWHDKQSRAKVVYYLDAANSFLGSTKKTTRRLFVDLIARE